MEFSKFDIVLITSMTLAIIVMSYMFPALGLADATNETQGDDIPEFNLSTSQFDIVGAFPDSPGGTSSGDLRWYENGSDGSQKELLNSDYQDGLSHNIINEGSTATPDVEVSLIDWVSGSNDQEDNFTASSEGQTDTLCLLNQKRAYEIDYEVTDYENSGQSNFTAAVDYDIQKQPADSGWISRIPIVGALFGAGQQLASIVGWIGAIIFWGFGTVVEVAVTIVTILFGIMSYGVDMGQFLTSTYTNVIAGVDGWASVILLVPAAILFAEFVKIAMIGISLLPTT